MGYGGGMCLPERQQVSEWILAVLQLALKWSGVALSGGVVLFHSAFQALGDNAAGIGVLLTAIAVYYRVKADQAATSKANAELEALKHRRSTD